MLASYRGPEGANAALVVGRVAEDQQHTAWDELVEQHPFVLNLTAEEEADLGPKAPPVACIEAERCEGRNSPFFALGGITACAVSAELYLIAATQGAINGKEGHEASDALIARALSKGAS